MAGQWRADPPPDGRTGEREVVKYDWKGVGEEARKHPDEWLMVDDEAGQYLLTGIKENRIVGLRADGWRYDAVTRKNRTTPEGTRLCELWISAIQEGTNT